MQRRATYRLIIGFVLILLFLMGCTAFVGRHGPPFYSGQDHQYFE